MMNRSISGNILLLALLQIAGSVKYMFMQLTATIMPHPAERSLVSKIAPFIDKSINPK